MDKEKEILEIYEPPETIYRADDYGDRYYYKVNGKNIEWFISNTTWQKQVIPPSPFLIKWYKTKSEEEINQILFDSSEYGTFMHKVFDWFLRGEEWNSEDKAWKRSFIEAHCSIEGIPCDKKLIDDWTYKIEKALRSLLSFLRERKVRPIASELMLGDTVNGFSYAGALDLVCEMDWNGKRVLALVDYKSGGIWDNHVYQLLGYQLLWNQQYPNRKITNIFNFRPKDWNGSPTFELKHWSDDGAKDEFRHYLEIAKTKCNDSPKDGVEFKGTLDFDGNPENTYEIISASERELKKFNQ